jgi:hypothetical protein
MPAWGLAAAAAKMLAMSPAGRKVAQQAAAGVARGVGKAGAGRVGSAQQVRKQRGLAYALARQVHGQLSRAVFIGSTDEHWVVWKDGVPMAAFPPVEGDLDKKQELAHVTDADRFEPPPAAATSKQGSLRDRLPTVRGRNKPSDEAP